MFRRETWRVGESAFAVLLLLIGTSMLDGFYGSYYNLNQLVFDAFDAPVSIIGIFFGASYAVNATAYIAADFFSLRFGKRNTMLGSMLIEAGLFMILPWFASNPLCLFGLSMVLCFLPEVVYITSENLIQDAIADDLRVSGKGALFCSVFLHIWTCVGVISHSDSARYYWCNRDSNYRRCFIKNGRNTGLQELIYRLTS